MMRLTLALFAALFLVSASAFRPRLCPKYRVKKFVRTAHNAHGLKPIDRLFRHVLGGKDNLNAPGELAEGHRSINWDAPIVPFDMPFDFFDKTVTRGALFKAKGKKFAVSNPASPPPVDDRFSSLLPKQVSKQFKTFSPKRLFTPVLGNKVAVYFKVPAKNIRATTTGFGAIFADVDRKRVTYMKFFDKHGCLIATIAVPPKNKGLSFAGLVVVDPHNPHKLKSVVAKVVIRLGNISVHAFRRGHVNKHADVVVLDDLIYGEPKAQHKGHDWIQN